MSNLIKWSELSRKLSGSDNSVRPNKIPKKYQSKVKELLTLIEAWENSLFNDKYKIMGLGGMIVSSSSYESEVVTLQNPKPDNYSLVRSEVVNGFLIIEIKYHDCTNYEGKKIMIFECSLNDLKKQKLIDPHFCDDDNYFSPIARFEPTERGWLNACVMANFL